MAQTGTEQAIKHNRHYRLSDRLSPARGFG